MLLPGTKNSELGCGTVKNFSYGLGKRLGTKALTLAHHQNYTCRFFLDKMGCAHFVGQKLDEMGINPAFLCLHDLKEKLLEGFSLIWQHTSNQSMASAARKYPLHLPSSFFLLIVDEMLQTFHTTAE